MPSRETGDPDLRLSCPASAENVAVVRRAVTGVARAVGLDEGLVNDVRTVITEACGNATVHAYPADAPGTVLVTCNYTHPWLNFSVRDYGAGMQPQVDEHGAPRLRIGLSLMSALSDRFEIQSNSGEGTEVIAGFDTQRTRDANGHRDALGAEPSDDHVGMVAAGPLGAEAIAPALVMLGVRSGFDVDRLAELQNIGAALASAVSDGTVGRLELRASLRDPVVEVEVDPGAEDAATQLVGLLPQGTAELSDHDGATVRIKLAQSG
jgi:serine/threonine-protein kinase RsbW